MYVHLHVREHYIYLHASKGIGLSLPFKTLVLARELEKLYTYAWGC
jgi:hypothetical protein